MEEKGESERGRLEEKGRITEEKGGGVKEGFVGYEEGTGRIER